MCMLRCTVGMRDWLVYEQSRHSSEYYPSFTLRLLRTQGSRMLENNKTVWWTLLNVALMPTVWRIHQSLCPGIFDFWIDVRIQSKTGFSRFQSSPSVVVEGKRILIYFKRLLVIIGMWISFGCVSVQGMVRMSCLGSALTPLSEHDVSSSLIKNTGGGDSFCDSHWKQTDSQGHLLWNTASSPHDVVYTDVPLFYFVDRLR